VAGVATRRSGAERQAAGRPRPAPEAILRAYLPPMLATLVDEAPPGEWHKEVKYDGYRALSALSNGRLAMLTRNGSRPGRAGFPRVARAFRGSWSGTR